MRTSSRIGESWSRSNSMPRHGLNLTVIHVLWNTTAAMECCGADSMELGELAAHISDTLCGGRIRVRNSFTRILLEPTLGTPTCGGQCPLTDRAGGIVNTQSISLARARELAHLVKATPPKRGKGARKKTGRASTSEVSPAFLERYLGHFGVGSAVKSGPPTSHHKSRTVKRPTRREKASRKKR